MLNKKEKLVLEFLFKNKDQYCTSQLIADNLGYSARTIREYIKSLTNSINNSGAHIIAKQGYGYQLVITDKKFINTILLQGRLPENKRIETPADRQYFIMKKLFFEGRYILFDTLEDLLFISHSTLSADFKKISQLISPYELIIKSKPNYGVTVSGDEKNIRLFIMDYFLDNDLESTIINYIGNSLFNSEINFEYLTNILLSECKKAQVKISDSELQQLALNILLSISRVKNGFEIHNNKNSIPATKHNIINNIITRLELTDEVKLTEAEINYIFSYVPLKTNNDIEQRETISKEKVTKEIIDILTCIEKKVNANFIVDNSVIESVEKHVVPLIKRLENNIHLANPFRNEIIEEYQHIFNVTKSSFGQSSLFELYEVSDDEHAYLTLHILASIEKNKMNRKLNTVIVCTTGYSSAMMIKNRLEAEFSEHLVISDIKGYYELTDEIIAENDLIISSIDLSNIVFKIPCVQTSIFLKEDECKEIKSLIDSLLEKTTAKKESRFIENKQILDKKSLVQHFFKEDSCIFSSQFKKEELINRLLGSMSHGESEKYIRRMTTQITQRELLSSVAFSQTIAVPHPAKPVGNVAKVGLAIVPAKVNWSKEYPCIQFIFLISPSSYDNSELKHITKAIIHLTENIQLQEKLLRCCDFDEFIELFSELIG